MRVLILLAVTLALAEAQRVKFPNSDRRPLKVVKLNKEDQVLEKAKAEVASALKVAKPATVKEAPLDKKVVAAAVKVAVAQKKAEVSKLNAASEAGKDKPVRIGPDGRPLLFGPKIELCQNSEFNAWFSSWFKRCHMDV